MSFTFCTGIFFEHVVLYQVQIYLLNVHVLCWCFYGHHIRLCIVGAQNVIVYSDLMRKTVPIFGPGLPSLCSIFTTVFWQYGILLTWCFFARMQDALERLLVYQPPSPTQYLPTETLPSVTKALETRLKVLLEACEGDRTLLTEVERINTRITTVH